MKTSSSWTAKWTPEQTLLFLKDLALRHLPSQRTAPDWYKRIMDCYFDPDPMAFPRLARQDLTVQDYENLSVSDAKAIRQVQALFKKLSIKGLSDPEARRAKAIRKFLEAEHKCKSINDAYRDYGASVKNYDGRLMGTLFRAQAKIARVLGDVPSWESLKFAFGPGATTLTKKREASVAEKLGAGLACSEGLVWFLKEILAEMPHLSSLYSVEENEDRWTVPVQIMGGVARFVPKDAETDRVVIIEPPLSTMVQGAIGKYMAQRLKRFGIDISDQTRNQRLALRGSLSGECSTLDLSSASDTISRELVYDLLPFDWAVFLDSCRSKWISFNGESMLLEKFSSMGNGYTFPLETLIFWALATSVSDGNPELTAVYGDDIIVPAEDADAVVDILQTAGFEINQKKSFTTGPFRESCGADYMNGNSIRPFYVREEISAMDLFRIHNWYVRNGDPESADFVRKYIDDSLLVFGPDGYGDGHLVGPYEKKRKNSFSQKGFGGYIFDTFKLEGRRDKRSLRPGDRILPLYCSYTSLSEEFVIDSTNLRGEALCLALRINRKPIRVPGLPLPERVSNVDGTIVKCPSLPGTSGYDRISIYTLS